MALIAGMMLGYGVCEEDNDGCSGGTVLLP